MTDSPENKIHFLGKEFDPNDVAVVGFLIALGGAWIQNIPAMPSA